LTGNGSCRRFFFDGDEKKISGSSDIKLPVEVATEDVTELFLFRFRLKTPKIIEDIAVWET
jgi:hypothetical protein